MTTPLPPKAPTYVCATYVEGRSPKWKYHTNIGHAKSAAKTHCNWNDVIVYDFVDGELVEKWFVPSRTYNDKNKPFPWEDTVEFKTKALAEKMRELRDKTARAERVIRETTEEITKLREEMERLEEGN